MFSTIATLVLVAAAPLPPQPDYQKLADEAKWDWKPEQATVLHSLLNYHGDYEVEVVKKPNTFGELTIRFKKDGKEGLAIRGTYATTFVGKDGIVYYADYHPSASGCAIVAFDLANRKELWMTYLQGIGPIKHFKYSNQVAVELLGEAVKVLGHEAAGDYVEFVEFVDLKTGKTVGHKLFRKGFKE